MYFNSILFAFFYESKLCEHTIKPRPERSNKKGATDVISFVVLFFHGRLIFVQCISTPFGTDVNTVFQEILLRNKVRLFKQDELFERG